MTSSFDPSSLAAAAVDTRSALYRFVIDGFDSDHFRVHAFTGREALSEPYSFDVVVTAETAADEEVERLALGQRAMLTWNVGAAPRAFRGVVAAVRLEEVHELRRSVQYHVRFVPRLWFLRRRRRSRIFQGLRVPEIVDAVLREAGISTRWQLSREYPVREYATQYEESDYRFVSRLLAEAGIYFYFPTGPELDPSASADALVPGETVIFGDDATYYPPIGGDDPSVLVTLPTSGAAAAAGDAPPLYFLPMQSTNTSHLDKITRFSARTTVRASSASFSDYDPERPIGRPSSTATSTQPFPSADPTTIEPRTAASAGIDLEVYDHHGRFLFPKWSSVDEEAALMLRQERRRAFTAKGESGCPDLAPGHRFALHDHSAAHLDRAYVVVAVEHRGRAHPQHGSDSKVYASSFECAPAEVTYVPRRPKRRHAQVALTATVVGPGGGDIHVDAVGQIKVLFHWDREGSGERSSCWIRTVHAWGGAGWGSQFLPRVGMEVVVVFEGGDPNKPIVMGSLYNGTHPPPFSLPGDRTRSGFRTQSSPGGEGYNELSFQDAAGHEQISVRAQRNLDEVVQRNHTLLVRNDEFIRVAGDRLDTIDKNLTARVKGNSTSQVGGSRTEIVTGSSDVWVEHDATLRVGGQERREVLGGADSSAKGDVSLQVRGCYTTLVGTEKAKRSYVVHVEGVTELSSSGATEIRSDKAIVLSCGRSSLRITDDKIEIVSPAVAAGGPGGGLSVDDQGLQLRTKKDALLSADTILLKASTASVGLAKDAQIDGKQILLNSPEQATDPVPDKSPKPTTITLVDQKGKPLANQRYLVTLADGSEVGGILDKDGKATLAIEGTGTITFPRLRGAKPAG